MWTAKRCLLSSLCVAVFIAGVLSSSSSSPSPPSSSSSSEEEDYAQEPSSTPRGEKLYSSCKENPFKKSDKYDIQFGPNKTRLSVYCEYNGYGGGWIVFQLRVNGSVDFYRPWAEYRDGFGSLDGEFWLGLESLHQLTTARPHELMVEIRDYHYKSGYARYGQFVVGSESEGYRLKIGNYSGTAGDSLSFSDGAKFGTKDVDNDTSFLNCAVHLYGAWWYNSCSQSNLNGKYGNITDRDWIGMNWLALNDDYRSMVYSRMMIREIN